MIGMNVKKDLQKVIQFTTFKFESQGCLKIFLYKFNLKRHLSTHSEVKLIVCFYKECDKTFYACNLKPHKKSFRNKIKIQMSKDLANILSLIK